MEVAEVGVRTRARALAAMAEGSGTKGRETKKRKVSSSSEIQYAQLRSRSGFVTLEKTISPAASVNSGRIRRCSSSNSDKIPAMLSRCSSNGSSELVNDSSRSAADLKSEGLEFEISTCCERRKRRETTPSSDLRAESDDLDSTGRLSSSSSSSMENTRERSTAKKMPTEAEIDEFFAVAEKEEKKRFAEKYNYDIVKDVPLEGRYEWVRLKP